MAEQPKFHVTFEVIVRESGEMVVVREIDTKGPKNRYLVEFPWSASGHRETPIDKQIPEGTEFPPLRADQWFDEDELDPKSQGADAL